MDILGSENINESLQTHFLIYKITNTINGSKWINNGIITKQVLQKDLQQYLTNGWKLGRKIK